MIVKLVLAYDGTDFHGWAKQARQRTVQGVLEDSLGLVLGEAPKLSVAGRTDTGVHARGQVASFQAENHTDLPKMRRSLNSMLGPEVVVLAATRVPASFDARRSATAREYRFRIDLGDAPDPFTARFVWHRPGELSLAPMRRAARHLVGHRDFASFGRSPTGRGASTVRDLQRLAVARTGDRLEITTRANGFLQQMVRSLVGTLVAVGEGRLDPEAIPGILAAHDRNRAGQVPPPNGLTLERVSYGRAGLAPASGL